MVGSTVDKGRGIIKLAIVAVGGQGGGVLTGWIEELARTQGYVAQATSVAGVAQRTGATIYYIEMAPRGDQAPVFSLAPSAGDVDVVIAAEMMEVGRAILRGFVTPDRTTLIGSTHRMLAVSEKTAPGDGITDAAEVQAAAEIAAQKLVLADFERVAVTAGSVISASLFGALAGAGALPFAREAFEAAIRSGGRGVDASLRAFDAGFAAASRSTPPPIAQAEDGATRRPRTPPRGPKKALQAWAALAARVDALPEAVHSMADAGLRKVVAFQDIAYGAEYLDRLEIALAADRSEAHELTRQCAKYLANAMAYDDVIRVADEKTRAARFARIHHEMGAPSVMQLTDYTHPRGEEIVSMMPLRLARWIHAHPRVFAWIDRRVNKGRRLRTDRLWPYLQLWVIAGLRSSRRMSLRHANEVAHLESWMERALAAAKTNPALAVELIKARRLVKGYSDTHARGLSKFDHVMQGAALIAHLPDAADWARRLIAAALADEEGKALEGALQTIQSL